MKTHSLWFLSLIQIASGSEGEKANVPFCLEAFLTVIAACLFWFSEISKPTTQKKFELYYKKTNTFMYCKNEYIFHSKDI